MSRIWFSRGLRGMLATRIQSDLLRAGFTAGPVDKFVDGDFGGNTETALKALQARRALPVNGAVDVETWKQLTIEALPTSAAWALPRSSKATASACCKATSTAPG